MVLSLAYFLLQNQAEELLDISLDFFPTVVSGMLRKHSNFHQELHIASSCTAVDICVVYSYSQAPITLFVQFRISSLN